MAMIRAPFHVVYTTMSKKMYFLASARNYSYSEHQRDAVVFETIESARAFIDGARATAAIAFGCDAIPPYAKIYLETIRVVDSETNEIPNLVTMIWQ